LIECFIGENADLFILGRTLAGLYEQPRTKVRLRHVDWIKAPFSMALNVDGLKIGIEVWDHADRWDAGLLEWCDVYAKRNMNARHPGAFPHKVIPFGLNWACHSRRSMLAAFTAIAGALPRASKARLHEVYRYLVTPHWRFFEHGPEQPVENAILFQTRVWEPEEAPGDEAINEQRIGLLLALRREFGHRVLGGVVPGPLALKNYPELITDQPCRQPQFIRWAKKPLIGIYFRGLFGSIGFKMAEYLAASKCIVSEPIENELPSPLDALVVYKSNEECLTACERLLSDRSLAHSRREQSWKYYEAYVSPRAHMGDLLARARERFSNGHKREGSESLRSGNSAHQVEDSK
jgi:hypothetical protein